MYRRFIKLSCLTHSPTDRQSYIGGSKGTARFVGKFYDKGTAKFVEKFYDNKTLREGNKMLVNYQYFDII